MAYVSRGCIGTPVFNRMFFFCNSSYCNSKPYDNPAKIKRSFIGLKAFNEENNLKARSLAILCFPYLSLVADSVISLFLIKNIPTT